MLNAKPPRGPRRVEGRHRSAIAPAMRRWRWRGWRRWRAASSSSSSVVPRRARRAGGRRAVARAGCPRPSSGPTGCVVQRRSAAVRADSRCGAGHRRRWHRACEQFARASGGRPPHFLRPLYCAGGAAGAPLRSVRRANAPRLSRACHARRAPSASRRRPGRPRARRRPMPPPTAWARGPCGCLSSGRPPVPRRSRACPSASPPRGCGASVADRCCARRGAGARRPVGHGVGPVVCEEHREPPRQRVG